MEFIDKSLIPGCIINILIIGCQRIGNFMYYGGKKGTQGWSLCFYKHYIFLWGNINNNRNYWLATKWEFHVLCFEVRHRRLDSLLTWLDIINNNLKKGSEKSLQTSFTF